MDTDKLVTMFLTAAVELNTLSSRAKSKEAAAYLLGGRDVLHMLAKTFQQASPLAVALFNSPVEVREG